MIINDQLWSLDLLDLLTLNGLPEKRSTSHFGPSAAGQIVSARINRIKCPTKPSQFVVFFPGGSVISL